MTWMKPRLMERRPGKRGLVVVLADVSASMNDFNKMLADELALVARKIPRLRVFAFSEEVKEVSPHRLHKVHVGCGTDMLLAIKAIADLNTERTLVMSDGETANGTQILRIAEQMTGRIDAFYCHDSRLISPGPDLQSYYPPWRDRLMQDLARCGQGRMITLDVVSPSRPQLREELSRSFFQPHRHHGEPPMRRYPDQYIQGDQIDFRRPPDKHFDVTQHVHAHHQTVIHHHRHAPQQIEHGEAGQQTTYLQGVQITEHQAPAEQRQQIADRGHVVEVRHQHAALPKPGIRMPGARQLALPAPARAQSSNSRPLGLPRPEQPMQPASARARVLAVLNGAKR